MLDHAFKFEIIAAILALLKVQCSFNLCKFPQNKKLYICIRNDLGTPSEFLVLQIQDFRRLNRCLKLYRSMVALCYSLAPFTNIITVDVIQIIPQRAENMRKVVRVLNLQ